ncbi:hypothetical protein L9F63_007235, partial [Diploptera punctata]
IELRDDVADSWQTKRNNDSVGSCPYFLYHNKTLQFREAHGVDMPASELNPLGTKFKVEEGGEQAQPYFQVIIFVLSVNKKHIFSFMARSSFSTHRHARAVE